MTESLLDDICAVWSRCLGRPVRPADDLFDIGGTSLDATRLAEALEQDLGAEVTVGWVLDNTTPASMVASLEVRS